MFDLGLSELLVIGVVALIVVGPKDLPMLFRNVGRFMGKARGMAREFSRAMNDAADQAGISRLYGGIHIIEDDLAGREIGAAVGRDAWAPTQRFLDGTAFS